MPYQLGQELFIIHIMCHNRSNQPDATVSTQVFQIAIIRSMQLGATQEMQATQQQTHQTNVMIHLVCFIGFAYQGKKKMANKETNNAVEVRTKTRHANATSTYAHHFIIFCSLTLFSERSIQSSIQNAKIFMEYAFQPYFRWGKHLWKKYTF